MDIFVGGIIILITKTTSNVISPLRTSQKANCQAILSCIIYLDISYTRYSLYLDMSYTRYILYVVPYIFLVFKNLPSIHFVHLEIRLHLLWAWIVTAETLESIHSRDDK